MASMKDNLFEAQAHLYRHILSFISPMSLKCAVELGIPDIIHNHGQPITLPHLLSALKTPTTKANCIRQLMNLLAHNGFFEIIKMKTDEQSEEGNEAYALTPASELLVKDSNHCLSSMVRGLLNPAFVHPCSNLSDWFNADGPTLTEALFGVQFWEYINRNHETLEGFNEAMASDSQVVSLALRDCKAVFEGLGSVVDVGGGTGALGRVMCDAFPDLKFIVLDRPAVVENLSGTNNLSFVGGSMFESIPQADAVLLKSVLHNWSDDDCLKILRKCKEAISSKGKGGKLIVIEEVMDAKQDNNEMAILKLLFDIMMMTAHNGKGRNEKEWENLFLKSGFKNYKIFPIFGYKSLIEAVLHNWTDDDCLTILRKCKGAISNKDKRGKLIVIDEVMDQKQDNNEMTQLKLLLDISMMTLLNGKGRNEKEWENLFFKSGFKNYKIFPIFGYKSLIEVYP